MNRLKSILEILDHTEWSVDGQRITVPLGKGKRQQKIRMERKGEDYVLQSIVLGRSAVTRTNKRWRELARLAWERNAQQEIVTFAFDKKDQLIGTIRHPADHLDPEELDIYIQALARECDRFEYLLTGEDIY